MMASRASGQLLIVDPVAPAEGTVAVGSAPNGRAVDPGRGRVMAADVGKHQACLVDLTATRAVAAVPLPGRPRWVCYESGADRYLLNVQDPPLVVLLAAGDIASLGSWPVGARARGRQGLYLDHDNRAALVTCDERVVITLDLDTGAEPPGARWPGDPLSSGTTLPPRSCTWPSETQACSTS